MKIKRLLCAPGASGFFFDDQAAIKAGAEHDGFTYRGTPRTPGFTAIRVGGESICLQALLENGQWAAGDAAAIQYSGAGGRDPMFHAATLMPWLDKELRPQLEGAEVRPFREAAAWADTLEAGGRRLHTALRYGISQLLLDARARATGRLMTEVLCEEYGLPVIPEPIPIFGQSGDDRYNHADKMILKRADVLPHALINNIPEKLGTDGAHLREYLTWLAHRVRTLPGDPSWHPTLHIDVYGTIGLIFGHDVDRMADYLTGLEACADGLPLNLEGPVDMGGRAAQIETMARLRAALEQRGSRVRLVADEWCNTLEDVRLFTEAKACHMIQVKTPVLGSIHNVMEAVLYCRSHGMLAYQGGTCNETDLSARVCVHLALAARPSQMLAKPGMGFDEGFCIVKNEMARTLAVLKDRHARGA